MAFFIGIDVLMRNLAGKGIGWIIELMEYAMLVATALAAPWVLREGGHVSVDILSTQLSGRWKSVVLKLSTTLGMLICGTILYYSALATWQAYVRDSQIVKTFIFPEWWINSLIPLCMLMMVVEFALLFRSGPDQPSTSVPPTTYAG
jgi:TRAP-type C4-dicarboxylate transport system permease small subunit